MAKEKLNPVAVNALASIFGAFNPQAEKSYRQSLEVIDKNPTLCNWLQLHSIFLVGLKIATIVSKGKSRRS